MTLKPVEITEEEYREIVDALYGKAIQLAKDHKTDFSMFYSGSLIPCSYDIAPKTFRSKEPRQTYTMHFMPFPCNCKKQAIMSNPEEVICLNWHGDEEPYKYYITTHRIGRCPWKVREED